MKHFVLPICALVIAIALVAGYVGMMYDIQQNIVAAGESKGGAETLTVRDASARSLEILVQETTEEREALSAFVLSDADVVEAIAAVEDAGRIAKVKPSISGISVIDLGLAHHEGVEVSFSVVASFAALIRFASVLESLPVASRLEATYIESSKDSWFGSFRVVFVKAKPS